MNRGNKKQIWVNRLASCLAGIWLWVSGQAFAQLPAPTNLDVDPANGSADIFWNTVSGASGYDIYRATASTGPFTKLNVSALSTASYHDSNLTNGTTYWYEVAAIDSLGATGTLSTPERGTPAPPGPTNVSGNISTASVWTPAGNPYIVTNAFTIYQTNTSNARLTIEPGVIVKFNSGTYSRVAQGNFTPTPSQTRT